MTGAQQVLAGILAGPEEVASGLFFRRRWHHRRERIGPQELG
jgi:hypothetical protein